jgi:hypothetical protein
MQRLSNLSWKFDVAILAGCVLFLAIGYQMRFQQPSRNSSVCGICGMLRDTTAWEAPGLGVTIFKKTATRPTPVSETLRTNSIVGVHRHDWQHVHASGPGLLCALGRASSISSTVRSKEVANLVGTLHRLGATELRDKVITALLNADATKSVGFVSQDAEPVFTSAAEIDEWLCEKSASLDEWLDELK